MARVLTGPRQWLSRNPSSSEQPSHARASDPRSVQEDRRPIVLVTGLEGSGKTRLALAVPPESGYSTVVFGSVMEQVADSLYHKRLSSLWPEERSQVQIETAKRIAATESRNTLLVSGQLVIKAGGGYEHAVPRQTWHHLALQAVVVVLPDAEEAWSNQVADEPLSIKDGYLSERRAHELLLWSAVANYAGIAPSAVIQDDAHFLVGRSQCPVVIVKNFGEFRATAVDSMLDGLKRT